MSQLIIQDAGYAAIMADPELAGARRKLSLHEIRLIVKHARENPAATSAGERCANCYGDVRGECIRVGRCIFKAKDTRP